MRSCVAAVALVLACGHPAAPRPPDLAARAAPGLAALDVDRLVAMTRDLSSDEMEGRASGSEGGARAEQYVADRFAEIGLEPAGTDGWFQPMPLRRSVRVDEDSALDVHTAAGDVAIAADALVMRPDSHTDTVAIDAPLVLVGYGISRPDLGYDDLAGVDLNGAIAVVFGGAPRMLAGKELDSALHAVMSDSGERTRSLRDHGASAVIGIYDPVRAERVPFEVLRSKVPGPAYAWLDAGAPASNPVLPFVSTSEATLQRILDGVEGAPAAHAVWEQLDRGEPVSFPLGTASLRITSTHEDLTARNVIGLLRGQTDEVVVYSAHLDHLGRGPAIDGDDIYNGAIDNAIGVAAITEIARAFRALSRPPRRSILFIAVTGEESGLLGSDYFAHHPTVPIDRIVAAVNIDVVNPWYEAHDVVALGAEHSSLAAHVDAAARVVGLKVSPDPDPAQVFFIRSDQYSFVKQGIPAVGPMAGVLDEHGTSETNQAIKDAWSAEHYHRPSDVWRDDYRAAWTLPELRFDFLLGLSIADADHRPSWNPGDAFATFAHDPE